MLSTHGYFDADPQLGRTDTGGQVVYVLELSKARGSEASFADIRHAIEHITFQNEDVTVDWGSIEAGWREGEWRGLFLSLISAYFAAFAFNNTQKK